MSALPSIGEAEIEYILSQSWSLFGHQQITDVLAARSKLLEGTDPCGDIRDTETN